MEINTDTEWKFYSSMLMSYKQRRMQNKRKGQELMQIDPQEGLHAHKNRVGWGGGDALAKDGKMASNEAASPHNRYQTAEAWVAAHPALDLQGFLA